MSRIVGSVSLGTLPVLPPLWDELRATHCVSEERRHHHRTLGPALFWWSGGGEPNLVAHEDILVAIDGAVFEPDPAEVVGGVAELIVRLFRLYGFPEAVKRLNGDFAVALYDANTQTLWLGRDRFGVRPLYYFTTAEGIGFASRPRLLFAFPGVSRRVNRRFVALLAASHYRYFDNSPEESPYADIAQLPAAHWLRFAKGSLTTGRYWVLEEEPEFPGSESGLAERYRELLLDAVSIRLREARRPAFTLSSGMDSSSVLAAAARITGSTQSAFSAVYKDKTYDESAEIRSALDGIVEDWHPIPVENPDVFALVRRMVDVHDEPVATATWLSHFLLCEQASQLGFESLFGGMGGDEVNAGEYEHFFYFFADLRKAGLRERLDQEVKMWIKYHDHPIFRKSPEFMEESLKRLVDLSTLGRCLPDRNRLGRYAAALNPEYFDLRDFEPVMEHPFRSYLKNRTYQDLTRETIPCCLRAEDRQTAAFGLDHFLPFLDHRLVEFMFRVPATMKYRDGVTKHMLREAMRSILPEETRLRVKKTGWNAPAHLWFSGPGRAELFDLIRSREFRERGIYRVEEVTRIVNEHEQIVSSKQPRENHMMFLWQLVNLEVWLRQCQSQQGN